MLMDHIGMFFFPVTTVIGCIFRILGRIAAPIFCMFLAEGFFYTSNKKNYAIRLGLFAVLSQFAYSFAEYGTVFALVGWNMVFTLFVSFFVLLVYEKVTNKYLKWCLIIALILLTIISDWAVVGPLMVLNFYINRDSKNRMTVFFSIIVLLNVVLSCIFCVMNNYNWYGELWQLGMFLFIPFIYLYDRRKYKTNKLNKWIFYLFYPFHLILLALIKTLI